MYHHDSDLLNNYFEDDYLESFSLNKNIDEKFGYFENPKISGINVLTDNVKNTWQESNSLSVNNADFMNITNQINVERKKLGRKKKNSNEIGLHNELSEDNLIRRSKNIFIDALLEFINSKIKDYNSKENKLFITINNKEYKVEKLLNLSEKITKDLSVESNKALFKKQIKNIFLEISGKYQNYPKNYNIAIIDELCTNVEFKEIADILNLNYLDCLKYYRRDEDALNNDKLECLKGLELIFDKLPQKLEKKQYDKNYEESLINIIKNIEIIFGKKKQRKGRKSEFSDDKADILNIPGIKL